MGKGREEAVSLCLKKIKYLYLIISVLFISYLNASNIQLYYTKMIRKLRNIVLGILFETVRNALGAVKFIFLFCRLNKVW